MLVNMRIPIQMDDQTNHHPQFQNAIYVQAGVQFKGDQVVERILSEPSTTAADFSCPVENDNLYRYRNEAWRLWACPPQPVEVGLANGLWYDWPEVMQKQLRARVPRQTGRQRDTGCAEAVSEGVLLGVNADLTETARLAFQFFDYEFERYEVDGDKRREQLVIGHYSTAGELPRDISIVSSAKNRKIVDVEWELPKKITNGGRGEFEVKSLLVRFFFTVRDQRGGFDSAMRELCTFRCPSSVTRLDSERSNCEDLKVIEKLDGTTETLCLSQEVLQAYQKCL